MSAFFTNSTCNVDQNSDVNSIHSEYIGNTNSKGQRHNNGIQIWNHVLKSKYAGNFFCNNMHGKGFYFIRNEADSVFYNGQFYCNQIEGYGQVVHKNCDVFEGLFKNNKRFGPGVLTHNDETQDVGLWDGNYLMRLTVSLNNNNIVVLGKTTNAKIKLLRFKNIVPVHFRCSEQAQKILKDLDVPEDILKQYPTLYNTDVRNKKSLFFDHFLYDLAAFELDDFAINVIDENSLKALSNQDLFEEKPGDICICTNERCIQLNSQLQEIEDSLNKTIEARREIESKLYVCAVCCGVVSIEEEEEEEEEEEIVNEDEHLLKESQISTDKKPKKTSSHKVKIKVKKSSKLQVNSNKSLKKKSKEGNQTPKDINKNEDETLKNVSLTDNNPILKPNEMNSNLNAPENVDSVFVEDLPKDSMEYLKLDNSSKICTCDQYLVKNMDTLLAKLESLKMEEKYLTTLKIFLKKRICFEVTTNKLIDAIKTEKLNVDKLLAWNNENYCIKVLQHCFRYRNFEHFLSYNIKDLLLGNRHIFKGVGKVENDCIVFIKSCQNNYYNFVHTALCENKVNPDVSDSTGNAGLHYAVSSNNGNIIKILANQGANLNIQNDEGLTPLLLSLVNFLVLQYSIEDIEIAFLKDSHVDSNDLQLINQWRYYESLLNVKSDSFNQKKHLSKDFKTKSGANVKGGKKASSILNDLSDFYLLSTDYNGKGLLRSATLNEDSNVPKLNEIHKTICTLLKYGANPNLGQVPTYPLLLSIFTKNYNLVKKFLDNKANPNVVSEDGLTALHILASLPFCQEVLDLLELFLQYKCNVYSKTPVNHWAEQNQSLVGNYESQCKETGKTALQILAIKNDQEGVCKMVQLLIDNGSPINEYYLGHNLISLAVFTGNVDLIKLLVNYMDINEPLEQDMGNALTVLGLKRFPFVKTFDVCMELLDNLMLVGANPFNKVYKFANIYEFFLFDNPIPDGVSQNSYKNQMENQQIAWRKIIENYPNVTQVNDNINNLVVEYLKIKGRSILIKIYESRAMKYLYLFALQNMFSEEVVEYLIKFLTPTSAVISLNLLFYSGILSKKLFDVEIITKIFDTLKSYHLKAKTKGNDYLQIENQLESVNLDAPVNPLLLSYIIDKPLKYEVCFHCLLPNDTLITCPKCGLIKFCSEDCNKFNLKITSPHRCNYMFYEKLNNKSYDKINDLFANIDNLNVSESSWEGTTTISMTELTPKYHQIQKIRQKYRKPLSTRHDNKQICYCGPPSRNVSLKNCKNFSNFQNIEQASMPNVLEIRLGSGGNILPCQFYDSTEYLISNSSYVFKDLNKIDKTTSWIKKQLLSDVFSRNKIKGNETKKKLYDRENERDEISELLDIPSIGSLNISFDENLTNSYNKVELVYKIQDLGHTIHPNLFAEGHKKLETADNLKASINVKNKSSLVAEITKNFPSITEGNKTKGDVKTSSLKDNQSYEINKNYSPNRNKDSVLNEKINISTKVQTKNNAHVEDKEMNEENKTKKPSDKNLIKEGKNMSPKSKREDNAHDIGAKEIKENQTKNSKKQSNEIHIKEENGISSKAKRKDDTQHISDKEIKEDQTNNSKKHSDEIHMKEESKSSKFKRKDVSAKEMKEENTKNSKKHSDEIHMKEEKSINTKVKRKDDKQHKDKIEMKDENQSNKNKKHFDEIQIKEERSISTTAKRKNDEQHKNVKEIKKDSQTIKSTKHSDKTHIKEERSISTKSKKKDDELHIGAKEMKEENQTNKSKKHFNEIHLKEERSINTKARRKDDAQHKDMKEERQKLLKKSKYNEKINKHSLSSKADSEKKSGAKSGLMFDKKQEHKEETPRKIIKSDTAKISSAPLTDLTTSAQSDIERISKLYQHFLRVILEDNPDFDLNCMLFPYACLVDGQFYYKFVDPMPYYCRTYSTM